MAETAESKEWWHRVIIYYSAVRRPGSAVRKLLEESPPSLMSSFNDLKQAGTDTEAFWAFMAIHDWRKRGNDGESGSTVAGTGKH